jgi:hypothetical protein
VERRGAEGREQGGGWRAEGGRRRAEVDGRMEGEGENAEM